jgi:hypothetical protein
MKWCVLVNDAPFLMEFLGKLVSALQEQGDECVLVYTNKIAEYTKAQYFPGNVRTVSRVDWCLEHYDSSQKNYGDLTWREFSAAFDRTNSWPWGYEASANILRQEYQFFEEFFRSERPDAVLFEPPAGLSAEIAYVLSLQYGIPYLGVTDSRISNRLDVLDSEYTNKRYQETFSRLSASDISEAEQTFAEHFLRDFLSHKRLPSYYGLGKIRFTFFGYVSHYLKRSREVVRPLWRYIRARKKFKDIDFESESRLRTALKAPLGVAQRQARIALQDGLYRHLQKGDKFYLFLLHMQPEASTLVQARHYLDQVAVVHNIAFALPFPYKLYVKEHPSALGKQPESFYRKIQEIPNVQLIAAKENIEELIQESRGVITLTSTAGMEAVLAGKPAYALGNVFYEYHPLCRTPKTMDELREQLLADRKNELTRENLDEENIRFVVSYLRNTVTGSVPAAVAEEDSNDYEQIAQDLKRIAQARTV